VQCNYLLYVTIYVTVYTLVAVSVLRFLVVVRSTTQVARVLHRPVSASLMSVIIWVVSLAGNSPTYGAFTVKSVGAGSTYRYCGVEDSALGVTVLAFFVLGYALPLTVISALYVVIACHVRHHRRRVTGPPRRAFASRTHGFQAPGHQNHRNTCPLGPWTLPPPGHFIFNYPDTFRSSLTTPLPLGARALQAPGHRNARTLRLVVAVVVVFGISWLPIHVQSLAGYFGFHSPDGAVYEVFRVVWNCMAYSNSCANPFIYHCRSTTAPRTGRLAQRHRQRLPAGGRVLPQCCQSASSFTSTVGRQRPLPLSQRTRTTYIRHTTLRTRQPLDTYL